MRTGLRIPDWFFAPSMDSLGSGVETAGQSQNIPSFRGDHRCVFAPAFVLGSGCRSAFSMWAVSSLGNSSE